MDEWKDGWMGGWVEGRMGRRMGGTSNCLSVGWLLNVPATC